MHVGNSYYACYAISTHCFYLKTCKVWAANIIVFVFLKTSCVLFNESILHVFGVFLCMFIFILHRENLKK